MNNVAKRKKSPGAIFRERSEPEGRVSGMIRANSVKICVRRSRTQHAAKPRYSFHSAIIFPTYSILSAYRACRDARRRVETGVSPTPKGGCGGHPPHIRAYTRNRFFAYQPHAARRVSRRRCPSHTTVIVRRSATQHGDKEASSSGKHRHITLTFPQHFGRAGYQVDDRGRLPVAGTAVDH